MTQGQHEVSARGSALMGAMIVTVAVAVLSMIAVHDALSASREAGVFKAEHTTAMEGESTWFTGVVAVGCEATGQGAIIHQFESWGSSSWSLQCDRLLSLPEPVPPPGSPDIATGFQARGRALASFGDSQNSAVRRHWHRYEVRADTRVGEYVTDGGVGVFEDDRRTHVQGYTYVRLTSGGSE